MRVMFNTYPMAFGTPGGGEMQLMAYYDHLPAHGVTPELFNLWQPRFKEFDLIHFFSLIAGSHHFCNYVKSLGLPLFITSSLWITDDTKNNYPFDEIKYQLGLADKIVTNSKLETQQLSRVFGIDEENFVHVYNGIDPFYLEQDSGERIRSYLPLETKFILNVGNIEPRKNQLSLVRAMKNFPNYKLVLIGYVRDREYANLCLEEGAEQVIYLGSMPHSSQVIKAAMASCSLFAMPSTLETPSLAALEAAAQGAKIVITSVGSAQEYFGDAASYVDPGSIESISSGIEETLSARPNGELQNRICKNFTWHETVKALADHYFEYRKD